MKPQEMLDILAVAEKLKCNTRHCYTSNGRRESVAEHSWRIALMAMLLSGEEEFKTVDMNKVIRMCLIHDLGEAITGDIPAFWKKEKDEENEDQLLEQWVSGFPESQKQEFEYLLQEMNEQKTLEAKTYKALDKLEAVIQHNESDIHTWAPNEYELNLTYAQDKVAFSEYLKEVRELVREETLAKIAAAGEG